MVGSAVGCSVYGVKPMSLCMNEGGMMEKKVRAREGRRGVEGGERKERKERKGRGAAQGVGVLKLGGLADGFN